MSNINLQRKRRVRREEKKAWGDIQSGKQYYSDRVNPQKGTHLHVALAEEGILAFLLKNPDFLEYVTERIAPETFITDFNREVFGIILQKLQNNNSVAMTDFSAELTPEKMGKLSGIVARQQEFAQSKEALDDYIAVLLEDKYKNASSRIDQLSEEELADTIAQLQRKKKPNGKA